MSSTPPAAEDGDPVAVDRDPLPEFVDWLAALAIVFGGLLALVGGTALTFVVDRDLIASGIESGTLTVTVLSAELTRAEAVEFALTVLNWTGMGLLVTGLGLLLFAIGYLVRRHRTHRRTPEGEDAGTFGAHAVLGAVTTGVTSFLPFSPVVGGAAAGYLERARSDRVVSVGAVSGALAMAPALVVVLFVFAGLVGGLLGVGEGGAAVLMGVLLALVLLVVVVLGVGLGALGGFVGGRLAESRSG